MAPVRPPPALRLPRGSLQRFCPLGQLFHYGGVDALRQLDSPSHSLDSPLEFSATLEASRIPSLSTTPENLPARFSCRPKTLSLTPGLIPWRPNSPASSAATEVTSRLSPLLAAVTPGSGTSLLPCDPRTVTVRVLLALPTPPLSISLLLLWWLLCILANPFGSFVCTLLLVGSLYAVPPPCSVNAYLWLRLVPSPACTYVLYHIHLGHGGNVSADIDPCLLICYLLYDS